MDKEADLKNKLADVIENKDIDESNQTPTRPAEIINNNFIYNNIVNESSGPKWLVSSKSLKWVRLITNSAVNDAFNNAKIELKESNSNNTSITKQVQLQTNTSKVSPSQISVTNSKFKVNKSTPFSLTAKNANRPIDYELLLKVVGWSLAVYSTIYYLNKADHR